ncbi:MAG: N-acetyl-gamma-glutamyl-phosphate reductase [Victivallales bacterium]|nr:N-acetyl-gamma-glutamyl-phosphate reductase [Victivallales bacterium]
MGNSVNVGIIGASGYSGEELIKLINRHPHCNLQLITSRQYADCPILKIFPRFGDLDHKFEAPNISKMLRSSIDIFFLALPHKVASEFAVPLFKAGRKIIDISADFRLNDKHVYRKYYKIEHQAPELLTESVYGLPEINREKIRYSKLVACPGCYPTSILLPLLPLIRENLVLTEDIVICSGSGVTGAGRKVEQPYLFSECNESYRAYSPVGHRHQPEIEQEISKAAEMPVKINFIPHLVPMNRGMNSTLILKLNGNVTAEKIAECYNKYYNDEKFIRVLSENVMADTKHISQTNNCEIGFAIDAETNKLIVTSSIDNLTKGASGQAVQCMNIIFGLNEYIGLGD